MSLATEFSSEIIQVNSLYIFVNKFKTLDYQNDGMISKLPRTWRRPDLRSQWSRPWSSCSSHCRIQPTAGCTCPWRTAPFAPCSSALPSSRTWASDTSRNRPRSQPHSWSPCKASLALATFNETPMNKSFPNRKKKGLCLEHTFI